MANKDKDVISELSKIGDETTELLSKFRVASKKRTQGDILMVVCSGEGKRFGCPSPSQLEKNCNSHLLGGGGGCGND